MADAPVLVVVVSYQTRELLDACLGSLRAQADAGIAQVCVVDNGSSDGSREMVRERHPWARLIDSPGNIGYGPAVNVGARATAGDWRWVVAANADLEFRPGALEALLAAGDADAAIGALGPRLELPGGGTQHTLHPFPGIAAAAFSALPLGRLAPATARRLAMGGHVDFGVARDAEWLTGAVLMIRRSAFEQVGMFDEQQWMYAEDVDLCWRLRGAGWRVRYEPSALVRHELSAAAREEFDTDMTPRIMRATYAWMLRRRGIGQVWASAVLLVAGTGMRLLWLTARRAEESRRRALREALGFYATGLRPASRIRTAR